MIRYPSSTALLFLLGALACGAANAQNTVTPASSTPDAPVKEIDPVNVNSIKDPEMRSYRSVWAGIEAFDDYHKLAPQANLRFQMTRKNGQVADASDGLVLRLATDEDSTPVPIDADGRFTVVRDRAAYKADATFILNKKSKSYGVHPDIRTPGLPDNVRRLGDLRLECRVMVAIIKEQIPFLARAAINTLLMTTDWCGKDKVNISFPSGKQVATATLRAGERSQELQSEGWRYMVPVGDKDWPDDALIELKYEGDAPGAAQTAGE